MRGGYEPGPHLRFLRVCAVIGVALATGALLFSLTLPTAESAADVRSDASKAAESNARLTFARTFFQILLLIVLARVVRRRWAYSPGAPATRALVFMTSLLAALSVLQFLAVAVQVVTEEYRVPVVVTASTYASLGAVAWAFLVVGAFRVYRVFVTQDSRLRRWDRNSQLVLAALCALPPLAVLTVMGGVATLTGKDLLSTALLSLPTTAFALWAVQLMQRYRRMPFRILLSGFGWGALVGVGLGTMLPLLYSTLTDPLLGATRLVAIIEGFESPVFEELAKGVGVLFIAVVARRWVTDVVSGLVVGASVGLGFNFTESVFYMATPGMGGAMYQHWLRQVVGIMMSHVAFSALLGAGIGAARQMRDPRARFVAVGCGLLTAISAHYFYNSLISVLPRMLRVSEPVFAMVVLPLLVLLLAGVFFCMYMVLLRRGLRHQSDALADELRHEADSGHDAITAAEVHVLLNPARRFRARVDAFRRDGPPAYRQLSRLYQAQLDLGQCRWHQARQDPDQADVDLAQLRRRIRRIRLRLDLCTNRTVDA